jgi:hypothetical protein
MWSDESFDKGLLNGLCTRVSRNFGSFVIPFIDFAIDVNSEDGGVCFIDEAAEFMSGRCGGMVDGFGYTGAIASNSND